MKMKKLILIAIVTLAVACNSNAPKDETVKKSEITEQAKLFTSDDLLKDISNQIDKEVAVKGTVVHVCKHGGKKLHLIGENPDERLIVFATEEVGKFERELEGSDIVLNGVVREKRIDEAYLDKWAAEMEEHHKDDEDKDAFHKEQENIEKMRAEVKASEKGYISKYRIEAKKFEAKEETEVTKH